MHQDAVEATTRWLEAAVLGLQLCPFARAPQREGRVRIQASTATSEEQVLADLQQALEALAEAPASQLETTLLVLPEAFADFLQFNDFLDLADALLEAMDLEGIIQIAPFHPQFQFADTEPDNIANATNRSPYPTLHLLRESSIEAAVATLDDPDAIYRRNIERLHQLGAAGWEELARAWLDPTV